MHTAIENRTLSLLAERLLELFTLDEILEQADLQEQEVIYHLLEAGLIDPEIIGPIEYVEPDPDE